VEPIRVAQNLASGRFPNIEVGRGMVLGRDVMVCCPEGIHVRFIARVLGRGIIDVPPNTITYLPTPEALFESVLKRRLGLYFSVSYVASSEGEWVKRSSGSVHALEKIAFEFEGKSVDELPEAAREVRRIIDGLSSIVKEPLIIYSGHKSYYIVLWFEEPITSLSLNGVSLDPVTAYKAIARGFMEAYKPMERYFDKQVLEPKRLLRVPGFYNERNGGVVQVLDTSLKPSDWDDGIMGRAVIPSSIVGEWAGVGWGLMASEARSVSVKPQAHGECSVPWYINELIRYLAETGELCHAGRMAIATWLLYCGKSIDEIVDVFRPAHDFNESITRYQVTYLYKNWIARGHRPIKCSTIVEKCGGSGKVPSLQCGRGSWVRVASMSLSRLTGLSPREAMKRVVKIAGRLSRRGMDINVLIRTYGIAMVKALEDAGAIRIVNNTVILTKPFKTRRKRRKARRKHARQRKRA
jgi:hypothetical protein